MGMLGPQGAMATMPAATVHPTQFYNMQPSGAGCGWDAPPTGPPLHPLPGFGQSAVLQQQPLDASGVSVAPLPPLPPYPASHQGSLRGRVVAHPRRDSAPFQSLIKADTEAADALVMVASAAATSMAGGWDGREDELQLRTLMALPARVEDALAGALLTPVSGNASEEGLA